MDKTSLGPMGLERDRPDYRDYTIETLQVKLLLKQGRTLSNTRYKISSSIDLSIWFSPFESQEAPGLCTTKAVVRLADYFEYQAFGKKSRFDQFLSEDTQPLLFYPADQGPYLRSAIKAIREYCLPVHYYRLDPPGSPPDQVLRTVKRLLNAKLPCVFGFSVYSSIPGIGDGTGDIPFPQPWDYLVGGLAVVAIGYEDEIEIGTENGALRILNPWGRGWGDNGYGWLPYTYIKAGLAVDFWSIINAEYWFTGNFDEIRRDRYADLLWKQYANLIQKG